MTRNRHCEEPFDKLTALSMVEGRSDEAIPFFNGLLGGGATVQKNVLSVE